jgi:SAM-dependent methyltransferase
MSLNGLLYDAVLSPVEAAGLAAERARVVAGAAGRVLEVGGGTGLNLAHYAGVSEVVVCEPDAGLRQRLVRRAAEASVPVTVVPGGVPGLAFADASFDTVVCTLVLCTVEDVAGSIAELRRLLRPDGCLLFLEHVIGRRPLTARVQRALAPGWARVACGCRLDRDTVAALRHGGFVVTDCERLAPLGRATAGTVVRGRAIPRRGT